MTYTEFINKHKGKGVDYDGTAGVQCVDLAKCYMHEVFGMNPGTWGDAHCYFDNFNNIPALKANFTRIANTPSFVPQKGDIMVWASSLSKGGWGHIAICTGEGNTTYFYSYDQNWTGKHDACTRIKHNYNHVLGVLRPKDQTKVTGSKAKTTAATATETEELLTFKVTASALRYRASASLSGKTVGTLKQGTKVQAVKGWGRTKDGLTWYKIKLGSKYYYCAAKYLEYVSG